MIFFDPFYSSDMWSFILFWVRLVLISNCCIRALHLVLHQILEGAGTLDKLFLSSFGGGSMEWWRGRLLRSFQMASDWVSPSFLVIEAGGVVLRANSVRLFVINSRVRQLQLALSCSEVELIKIAGVHTDFVKLTISCFFCIFKFERSWSLVKVDWVTIGLVFLLLLG